MTDVKMTPMAILALPSLVSTLNDANLSEEAVRSHLVWLVLPVLLSSLLFSIRGTIVVAVASLVSVLPLPIVKSEMGFGSIGGALAFIITTSGVMNALNEVAVAHDGVEALDYLFGAGLAPDATPSPCRSSFCSISSSPESTN